MSDAPPSILEVRSRVAQVAGLMWAVAAVALAAAAVALLMDEGRVSFELPSAVVAAVVAVWIGRQRCCFDAVGVEIDSGWRRSRRLWSTLVGVEVVADRWRPAIQLRLTDGAVVALPATFGLSAGHRAELVTRLQVVAAAHGVPVEGDAATADATA